MSSSRIIIDFPVLSRARENRKPFLQCMGRAFSLCCLVENDGSKGFGMTVKSVKSIFQWSVMVKLFRNFPSWPFHDEIYIANNFSTLEIKFLKK
jgi:hypothetical protein